MKRKQKESRTTLMNAIFIASPSFEARLHAAAAAVGERIEPSTAAVRRGQTVEDSVKEGSLK